MTLKNILFGRQFVLQLGRSMTLTLGSTLLAITLLGSDNPPFLERLKKAPLPTHLICAGTHLIERGESSRRARVLHRFEVKWLPSMRCIEEQLMEFDDPRYPGTPDWSTRVLCSTDKGTFSLFREANDRRYSVAGVGKEKGEPIFYGNQFLLFARTSPLDTLKGASFQEEVDSTGRLKRITYTVTRTINEKSARYSGTFEFSREFPDAFVKFEEFRKDGDRDVLFRRFTAEYAAPETHKGLPIPTRVIIESPTVPKREEFHLTTIRFDKAPESEFALPYYGLPDYFAPVEEKQLPWIWIVVSLSSIAALGVWARRYRRGYV